MNGIVRLLSGSEPVSTPLSLREEFRFRRFGLQHDEPRDFMRSQWQSKPKSVGFLVYRWLLGGFFGTGLVSYFIKYFQGGHWLIYLTNWGFLMCGITSVTGAVLVTLYHYKPDDWVPPSGLIKFYWASYWTNLIITGVVSLTYWLTVYPADRRPGNPTRVSDLYNIWTHALPPIFYTVDHLVVAQPSRLLHFVYPLGFSLIYTGFTLVFYVLGGVDLNGRRYIYSFLNYAKPKSAILTITRISFLIVALSSYFYGLYRVRSYVARKLGFAGNSE
ncbi:protein rolling stone-like [Drosophila bipectinata]|uniref:protein rolling stone-like n=1 Tax=Drosophila bipectinata TaxID=42026 RepID=UPI0007E7A3A7|nr:protein rolling stone-like [Drosophila bipectinata]